MHEIPPAIVQAAHYTMKALALLEGKLERIDSPIGLFGMIGLGERNSEFSTGYWIKYDLENDKWDLAFDLESFGDDPDPGEHEPALEPEVEEGEDAPIFDLMEHIRKAV